MDIQLWGADPVNGRSKWVIADHYGPASYVTGGEVWPPQNTYGGPNSMGLNGLQWVHGGRTEDLLYTVIAIFGGNAGIKGQIKLKWLVVSTGLEVSAGTNLSASYIRLLAVGG